MNVRLRRREARRELHAVKYMEARLLGVKPEILAECVAKTRNNIHRLQININDMRKRK